MPRRPPRSVAPATGSQKDAESRLFQHLAHGSRGTQLAGDELALGRDQSPQRGRWIRTTSGSWLPGRQTTAPAARISWVGATIDYSHMRARRVSIESRGTGSEAIVDRHRCRRGPAVGRRRDRHGRGVATGAGPDSRIDLALAALPDDIQIASFTDWRTARDDIEDGRRAPPSKLGLSSSMRRTTGLLGAFALRHLRRRDEPGVRLVGRRPGVGDVRPGTQRGRRRVKVPDAFDFAQAGATLTALGYSARA